MPRKPKSRDEIAASAFKMYRAGFQWKQKLAAGEITENELWEKAFEYADQKINERMDVLATQNAAKVDWSTHDQMYREERERQYRKDYDWTVRSDEKILENILTIEVNIRRMERELQLDTLTVTDRDKISRNLSDYTKTHKDLLVAAGIDRVTREKRKAQSDPMEDWERIKTLASEKMDELEEEFKTKITKVSTEAELRDRVKYHLGYGFEIVDALLANHRRVLGLSEVVEKS